MSNKVVKNIFANLLGTGWNGLLTVLVTPWYVSLLGLEGYGLVGFWLLMQVIISLFDLGLGATLVREFARSNQYADGVRRQGDLVRTLEYFYWSISLLITISLFVTAGYISTKWLKLSGLSTEHTAVAIQWMALALGLQFPSSLYSSGLAGLQKQGTMNLIQIIGYSIRHGCGIAILFWRADAAWFFLTQAAAVGLQTIVTKVVLWRLINGSDYRHPVFCMDQLRRVWRFSAGMTVTMIAGILLVNMDRLFLSKVMPAADMGKYTLAWTAAGILQLGIQPFYRAFFPRFAELIKVDAAKLRSEYYQGCKFVAGVVITFALIGCIFAPHIFIIWIGSADETVVAVFRWLLIGMAGAGLMWLPAAYQQAHGWTRLHASMIVGALVLGVPLLWWSISRWGTVGATAAWVLHGISDATLGLWLMHKRLLPGEFSLWYRSVVVPPLLISFPLVGLSWLLLPPDLGRWSSAAWLGLTGILVTMSILIFVNNKSFDFRNILQADKK